MADDTASIALRRQTAFAIFSDGPLVAFQVKVVRPEDGIKQLLINGRFDPDEAEELSSHLAQAAREARENARK